MSTDKAQRLFPLYLTPLERFFCADDQPAHPMTFTVQLHLTGVVDRRAFEQAIEDSLRRHPLLHALTKRVKRGKLCWVKAAGDGPPIDWADDRTPIVPERGEPIDLSRESGLRIWIRQGSETVDVTFQFHHACTDGIGAYRFIGDALALYGLTVGGPEPAPKLEPPDLARLRDRVAVQVELWQTKRYAAMVCRGLGQLWRLVRRRPTQLQGNKGQTAAIPYPGFQSASLSREEHEALREAARCVGATLNDLLLAVLFQTLQKWCSEHNETGSGSRLRIMMPTDLREAQDFTTPAASLTSYTFLTRPARDCGDWAELLPGIRQETREIRTERAGLRFADAVAMAFHIPGLMPLILTAPICLATVVMSNIGDPTRRFTAVLPRRGGSIVAGNLVLDDVTGVPPLRPHTRAAFSIFTYMRRLTISLRCEPQTMSAENTRDILELFTRNLRQCVAAGAVATASH